MDLEILTAEVLRMIVSGHRGSSVVNHKHVPTGNNFVCQNTSNSARSFQRKALSECNKHADALAPGSNSKMLNMVWGDRKDPEHIADFLEKDRMERTARNGQAYPN